MICSVCLYQWSNRRFWTPTMSATLLPSQLAEVGKVKTDNSLGQHYDIMTCMRCSQYCNTMYYWTITIQLQGEPNKVGRWHYGRMVYNLSQSQSFSSVNSQSQFIQLCKRRKPGVTFWDTLYSWYNVITLPGCSWCLWRGLGLYLWLVSLAS